MIVDSLDCLVLALVGQSTVRRQTITWTGKRYAVRQEFGH